MSQDQQRPDQKLHLDFLDGIRGVAITFVFFYHVLNAVFGKSQLGWNGWLRSFSEPPEFLALLPTFLGGNGVAIFFVVSGFCIHLSFKRQRVQGFKRFYIRRFFRIYPPYLAAVLFFAFIFPTTQLDWTVSASWLQLITHLLAVHNFSQETFFGINASFWSIAVEIQLYLIYPILLFLVDRFGWKHSLWGIGLIEIALRLYISVVDSFSLPALPWLSFYTLVSSPLFYWFCWSIGAAIAEAYLKEDETLPLSYVSPIVWLICGIGSYFFKPTTIFSFFFFALFTAAIIARSLRGQSWNVPHFLSQHMKVAGIRSYSIYLLHQPFVNGVALALGYVFSKQTVLFFLLCSTVWFLVFVISKYSFRYIELRGIRLGKNLVL